MRGLLDPTRPGDRALLDAGARSLLAVRLGSGPRAFGVSVYWSSQAGAFGPEHAAALQPCLALLAVYAERDRQHARARQLDALLPQLAAALDVRKVFLGMSQLVRRIVPHDVLAFSLLAADGGGVQVQAATLEGLHELPERAQLSPCAYAPQRAECATERLVLRPHDVCSLHRHSDNA